MQSCHCYALLDLNTIPNASIAGNVSRTTTLLFAEPAEYDCTNYTLLFLSRTLLLLRHRQGNNCKKQTSIFPPILSSSMHPVYKVSGLCKHRNMGIGSTTHRCCMSPTKAAMCSDKGLGIHSQMALETPTSSNSKANGLSPSTSNCTSSSSSKYFLSWAVAPSSTGVASMPTSTDGLEELATGCAVSLCPCSFSFNCCDMSCWSSFANLPTIAPIPSCVIGVHDHVIIYFEWKSWCKKTHQPGLRLSWNFCKTT